ncbi:hypothetical protein HanRHA438_Chr03g0108311 [Helianthus annuus]|nr:hypothetical protein HanRHA438_Chr03g0108311 [Helianthus annuus]
MPLKKTGQIPFSTNATSLSPTNLCVDFASAGWFVFVLLLCAKPSISLPSSYHAPRLTGFSEPLHQMTNCEF